VGAAHAGASGQPGVLRATASIELRALPGNVARGRQPNPFGRGGIPAFVAALRVGEELLVAADHVVGRDDRERTAGSQGVSGLGHPDAGIDPVKGRRGEHGVERLGWQRPRLEGRVDDANRRERASLRRAPSGDARAWRRTSVT
jgi:hypothetical protein